MKKNNFLMLLALAILLFACRAENLSEDSHDHSDSENIHKVTSKKVFPSEFQKIVGLNDRFGTSESFLSQKMKTTGKNILDGAVIDSSFAMETTDGVVISYTFPVYRNNQKNVFENLVLQKKVGEQNFRSYLYKYYRTGANTYNTQNIEIYNLDDVKIDTNGKIRLTTTSSAVGCYEIQTTTSDCGFKAHHTNGQYCPQSEGYMPLDYVTTFDNCPPSGGGGNTGGSGTNTGNPYTGGTTTFSYGLATPVPTYPKWGYCNPRTGSQWNALNLNTAQLSFINDAKQNAFRGEMVSFLANNEIYIFDCNYNPGNTISADVKNVGLWIVDYSMTNPEFLNSEFWSNFVASDIRLQKGAMDFINQNSISWNSFEPMFTFADNFLQENPDTTNPEQIFQRIKGLDDALAQNSSLLLDIPCSQLPEWNTVANHQVSQALKNKLNNIQGQTNWFNSWEIQNIDNAFGPRLNMDLFPTRITNMPHKPGTNQKYTPAEFFDYFRKNINSFVDPNLSQFHPIVEPVYGLNEMDLWNSSNPLGALVTIGIPGDNGTVMCTGYNGEAWVFTTVKAPIKLDGIHPVSGHRLFGYWVDNNGFMYLFTRGVDRFTKPVPNNTLNYLIESLAFSQADKLWKSMQTKIVDFVNNSSNGGLANKLEPVTYRPAYMKIRNYLKGTANIQSLGCN